jgi:anaerobic selenocysteine-containing dehydrogenase/Fe-S-cluster-containing dehydrogenase component
MHDQVVFPRRDFLKLVGLGVAGAAAGCAGAPPEKLIPYLVQPTDVLPGIPYWYASTCQECPAGCGILVKQREGRAIKIEGNPAHPVNRGGLCARGHAALQGLYDPDRVRGPMRREGSAWKSIGWDEALRLAASGLSAARGRLAFVTGNTTGSFQRLCGEWAAAAGGTHLIYEPFAYESMREANRRTFGVAAVPGHDFARARFLISFGADFLETWGAPTANARGFAAMRATTADHAGHFVAVEPRLSLTGANADEWIAIPPGRELALALGMAHVIVFEGLGRGEAAQDAVAAYTPDVVEQQTGVPAATVRRLARSFAQQRPSLAVAGGVAAQHEQSVALLAAINLLNWVAGNVGETVRFDRALNFDRVASFSDVQRLVTTMGEGQIGALVVHGANPVYAMPGWSGFAAGLDKVPFKLSLSGVLDETSERCDLILPSTHFLESLGDDESVRGVHSLVQPAMQRVPAFEARPAGETLITLARAAGFGTFVGSWPEYLRQQWGALHGRLGAGADFEAFWSDALRDGGAWEEAPALAVAWAGVPPLAAPELRGQGDLALVLYPSPHLHDGRGANKSWLQELPDPTTKAVWGSWVEIHPETAGKLGVRTGDVVRVETEAGAVEVPAYLYPGIRKDTIAVPLGQGHTAYGRYARGRGINALALLPPAQDAASGALAYLSARARVTKVAAGPTGPTARNLGPQDLVLAQPEKQQSDRGIAQVIPVAALLGASAVAPATAAPDTTRLAPALGARDTAHGIGGDTTGEARSSDSALHAGGVPDIGERTAAPDRAVHPAPAPGAELGHGEATHHPALPSQTRPGRHTEPRAPAAGERTPAHAVTAYEAEHPARAPRQIPVAQGSYGHAQHRWAMAIDLNSCTGCAACVTACYAENNIPAVGPDLVRRGRDMAWLRIERYEEAVGERNDVRFVPMLCQHCTDAPCETVCPVYATYHNPEGLNAQVYNRCVGTRYCSNNCPYKVRSFNFFDYSAPEKETFAFPEPLNWQLNPDVTVRSKGVMEKCTFCVQRILEGKGNARDQGRPLRDGEIQTACGQSCPTQAIVFGDLLDPESRVSQLSRHGERRYWVLNELNTKPAITYLKKIAREVESA